MSVPEGEGIDPVVCASILAAYPFALKVIITDAQIQERMQILARRIVTHYQGRVSARSPLLLVSVLKGCCMFLADLARAIGDIGLPVEMDFLVVSSYHGGTATSGTVKKQTELRTTVKGRHVLVLDDIVDSGLTMQFLKDDLWKRAPASLAFATLLDKKGARRVPFEVDFVAFECPMEFVVGYGLDYNERFRELRHIVVLKPEMYLSKL